MLPEKYKLRLPNYNHQQEELEQHRYDVARALIWQMRTGKTKAMIDLACALYTDCEIDCVVVVAPNNVHTNWQYNELPKHHWNNIPYRSFVWEANKFSSKRHQLNYLYEYKQHCKDDKKLSWYMVNLEALQNINGKRFLAGFLKSKWRALLIVDEVHEFRWSESMRAKTLRSLSWSKHVGFKRILSANPLDNNPLHAYSIFNILVQNALGFKSFEAFDKQYTIKKEIYVPGGTDKKGNKRSPRKQLVVDSYKNLEDLRERIAKWSSLVMRKDCADMPELLYSSRVFKLSDVQVEMYNKLVAGLLVKLDSGEYISPVEGGALAIRLQQISSGFTVDEDGKIHDIVPWDANPRLQNLLYEISNIDGKIIVWCKFRHEIEVVTAFLNSNNIGAVSYYGKTSSADRIKNISKFKTSDKIKVFVGQFQAGGQGLDFSVADTIIWFSQTSDLLKRKQADERATAIGGRPVVIIDLVAFGTNDKRMLDILEGRKENADFLTGNGLKDYFKLIKQ